MINLQKKSKCRITGRPIGLFKLEPQVDLPQSWHRTIHAWLYTDVSPEEALRIRNEDKVHPLPQDFCWRSTYEGDPCTSKIQTQNVRAQLWACGRHMAQFQEEQDRQARNRAHAEAEKQREALAEWQLTEHIRVYERLQELGWGAILPKTPPRKSWGAHLRDTEIEPIGQAEFLALVEPPEDDDFEEEYEDDDEFTTVEENFFASDM